MIIRLILLLAAVSVNVTAMAAVNPSSVKLRIFHAYVSENGDCSSPITLVTAADQTNGDEFDMVQGPTMGEGFLPPKKFKCFIMDMSDQVVVSPATSEGNCVAGQSFTIDVCRPASGQPVQNPFTGVTSNCTSGRDRVYVYVSTDSGDTGASGSANSFRPPGSAGDMTRGIKLQNEIDGTAKGGAFIFNANNKVQDEGSSCGMAPPLFGFRVTE